MKKIFALFAGTILIFSLLSARAQFGSPAAGAHGPSFGGSFGKLFGDNQTFSATLSLETTTPTGDAITMPGKISYDSGKSRFEFNMSSVQGTKMPPEAAAQMKSMGLDQMVSISRPDLKMAYVIYPGMNAYAESALGDSASTNLSDVQMKTTAEGKETVDGHDCTKNIVTVTDKEGNTNSFIVWNATDLKNFPVKIVTQNPEQNSTMLFKNISFSKPSANSFDAPSTYTKYDDVRTLMQSEIMKKMGKGGFGGPPPQ
jgi:hypothetical protein